MGTADGGAAMEDKGTYGVLRKGEPRREMRLRRAEMNIELLGRKATNLTVFGVMVLFVLCVLFRVVDQAKTHDERSLISLDAAAAATGFDRDVLIGTANYQPFTSATASDVFQFESSFVVLPPNITATAADGKDLVALQWLGSNVGERDQAVSLWMRRAYYVDTGGMALSGEDVVFEVDSLACWGGCSDGSNWQVIFAAENNRISSKVVIDERNAAGTPTKIHWDIVSYNQVLDIRQSPGNAFSVRYLNDPGDTAAGYSVFALNGAGGYGSCAADDGGCMSFDTMLLGSRNYQSRGLAVFLVFFTLVTTIVWLFKLLRGGKGLRDLNIQQKWTLLLAGGVFLYENPAATVWSFTHPDDPLTFPNRTFTAITAAGLCISFIAAACWADCANLRLESTKAFYLPKIIYAAVFYLAYFLSLIAEMPASTGSRNDTEWAASAYSWGREQQWLLTVAGIARLSMWLLGGFYYYYFLHTSFHFYNKIPYMLTRAEQLSFRFVVGTFSYFVFTMLGYVIVRSTTAAVLAVRYQRDGATSLAIAAAVFDAIFAEALRSTPMATFLAGVVVIFQFAFLPASARQLAKDKPKYIRLERDLRYAGLQRRSAVGSAAARAAGEEGGGATLLAPVATAKAAVLGRHNRPLFVIERARWLCGISLEAYSCFDEEEFAELKGAEPMLDVAPLGCDVVALITEDPENNLHDTHCLIVRHRATRRLVVAFRGTASKKQMKTDLQLPRCRVNLDLLANVAAKKKACDSSSGGTASTVAATTAASDATAAAAAAAASASTERPSSARNTGKLTKVSSGKGNAVRNIHIATEDNLPPFLLRLSGARSVGGSGSGSGGGFGDGGFSGAATASMAAAGSGSAPGRGGCSSEGPTATTTGGASAAAAVVGVAHNMAGAAVADVTAIGAQLAQDVSVAGGLVHEAAATGVMGIAATIDAAKTDVAEATGLSRETTGFARFRRERQARLRAQAAHGRLHFGFWSSYSTVRERVQEVVVQELLKEPGQLYLTGHSLGGALATLCAYDMALWVVPAVNAQLGREVDAAGGDTANGATDAAAADLACDGEHEEHDEKIKVTMYNYGSPRVGDPFFVRRYNHLVPNSFRVICDGDVITGMPPARFGFMHIGHAAISDKTGSGSLLIDPSLLETSFKTSRALKVLNHLMGSYMTALDGCLYPIESPEEMRRLIDDIYKNRQAGAWFGCSRFWLTCDGRLCSCAGGCAAHCGCRGGSAVHGGDGSGGGGGGGGGGGDDDVHGGSGELGDVEVGRHHTVGTEPACQRLPPRAAGF